MPKIGTAMHRRLTVKTSVRKSTVPRTAVRETNLSVFFYKFCVHLVSPIRATSHANPRPRLFGYQNTIGMSEHSPRNVIVI